MRRRQGLLATLGNYRHVLRWAIAKRIPGREFIRRKIYSCDMLLSLREPGISQTLNTYGSREPEHYYILMERLAEGMRVLDLGANIGYYTLMMANRVGPDGGVLAVEPVPANFRILEKNVDLNGYGDRVELFPIAISDSVETRQMRLSDRSNLHTFHDDQLADCSDERLGLTGETISVETMDLDAFLEGKELPDLIRMDVEGHEVEILTSLAETLRSSEWRPQLVVEVHPTLYDDSAHDIWTPVRALFELGYRPTLVASQREPAKTLDGMGYAPADTVADAHYSRGIYREMSNADFLTAVRIPEQLRCVLFTV